MFVYGGWDGTLYVNEEVKHRRVNPGRAAIIAVALLAIIYTLAQVGFQGVVSPGKLQANSANALVYVAQALGGGFWAKMMALSIALSVIATTGTGIVLSARIAYGMASYRALPGFLGNVSRRYKTPAVASAVVGVLLIAIFWVYMLATSVQNAFYDVIDTTGLLFAIFYILTALATIVYYRRRVFGGFWDFIILGVLPLGAAGFLGWMFVQDPADAATSSQRWSLIGIIALGLVMMFVARVFLQLAVLPDRRGRATPKGPQPRASTPARSQQATRLRPACTLSADGAGGPCFPGRPQRPVALPGPERRGQRIGLLVVQQRDRDAGRARRRRGSAPTRAAATPVPRSAARHEGQHVVGDGCPADQRRDPARTPAVARRSARRSRRRRRSASQVHGSGSASIRLPRPAAPRRARRARRHRRSARRT